MQYKSYFSWNLDPRQWHAIETEYFSTPKVFVSNKKTMIGTVLKDEVRDWLLETIGPRGTTWEAEDAYAYDNMRIRFLTKDHAMLFKLVWQ